MSQPFFISQLALSGHRERYEYDFRPGVNVITGPVGTGKSSLLELIKYCLGGSAILTQAVHDAISSVTATLAVERATYLLTRHIGATELEVREAESGRLIGTFGIRPRPSQPWISDFLLDMAGLPRLSIPRSRRNPTANVMSLSFFDVYKYLYLPQGEIDRSVVRHDDRILEPKRRAAFEVFYGLSDARVADLQVRIAYIREAINTARSEAKTIRTFLERAEERAEEELIAERVRLKHELEATSLRLSAVRSELRDATSFEDERRGRLYQLEQDLRDAETRAEVGLAQIERRRSLIAQLELEEQRIAKALIAGDVLSGIEFAVCPRCLQSLTVREIPGDRCYVCLLPESREEMAERLVQEQARLRAQVEETLELLDEDEASLKASTSRTDALREQLADLRLELDARTREYVSPRFEEIEVNSARVAELHAGLSAVDRSLRYWQQYRELEASITQLQQESRGLEEELRATRDEMEVARQRVVELSGMFDEILVSFQFPWYSSARIDLDSYLPVVNGQSFDALGSGGMKTLVNDAYHLANLTYALSQRDSLLPLFLVIDSPRKNLGSGVQDSQISLSIYRRFRTLADAYQGRFQLIVADNNVPEVGQEFVRLSFDYERPLIPEVAHPGPEHVQTIGGTLVTEE